MADLSVHIVVVCMAIGFFVAIEGFSIVDNAFANERRSNSINNRWLNEIEENLKLYKQDGRPKTNKIIAILFAKKHNNDVDDRERHGRGRSKNAFLQILNSFIHKYTKNNIYGKREVCSFGFENLYGKCRRQKRHSLFGWPKSVVVAVPQNTEDYRRNQRQYHQHMLVERARDYEKSSETEYSESSSDERTGRGKSSRFQIVDNLRNKKKYKQKVSSESEESDSRDTTDSDYAKEDGKDAEYSDYPVKNKNPNNKLVDDKESSESDNSDEGNEPIDSKYMYLQGGRLLRPRARTRRDDTRSRLPHFLPKRFHWDPDAIHDLDTFWLDGIKPKKFQDF